MENSFIICIKMNIYCCKILFYFVCGVYHNQSFNTLILQNWGESLLNKKNNHASGNNGTRKSHTIHLHLQPFQFLFRSQQVMFTTIPDNLLAISGINSNTDWHNNWCKNIFYFHFCSTMVQVCNSVSEKKTCFNDSLVHDGRHIFATDTTNWSKSISGKLWIPCYTAELPSLADHTSTCLCEQNASLARFQPHLTATQT